MLDVATIVVLGSGLYLWLKRGSAARASAQTASAQEAEEFALASEGASK